MYCFSGFNYLFNIDEDDKLLPSIKNPEKVITNRL